MTQLQEIPLFDGIAETELHTMLGCLEARTADYRKGGFILMEGNALEHVGIMLSGQATVYKTDLSGNRTVITPLRPPQLFAESFVCAGLKTSPVTVQAAADAQVLLISFGRIMHTCPSCCTHHTTLIGNMLKLIARKNIAFGEKLDHIAHKTTRQKLASYLLEQARHQHSRRFDIGLDRQALADYLCVNRSALSRELSRMKTQGALDFHRSSFLIQNTTLLEQMRENSGD